MNEEDVKSINPKKQYVWIKLYRKVLQNPKIRMMEEKHQLRLIYLWLLKSGDEIPHKLSEEEIAYKLRITKEDLAETKAILLEKGQITEDWDIPNWKKYQSITNNPAKNRVRKLRERRYSAGIPANVPPKLRHSIFERDKYSCIYCNSISNKLCIDHLIPFSRIKRDPESIKIFQSARNLAASCRSCNLTKSRMLPEEAGLTLQDDKIRKMYLTTKDEIFDRFALGNELPVEKSETVSLNGETVSLNLDWPNEEKIKEYETIYPSTNVKERINYIKRLVESKSVKIEKDLNSYISKALQEEQKKKEGQLISKIINELLRNYNSVPHKKLAEKICEEVAFSNIPESHATMLAKVKGLNSTEIIKNALIYKEIIDNIKNDSNFSSESAISLAKEKGILKEGEDINKLPRFIRRFIKNTIKNSGSSEFDVATLQSLGRKINTLENDQQTFKDSNKKKLLEFHKEIYNSMSETVSQKKKSETRVKPK